MPRQKTLQGQIERAQREVLIQHLRNSRTTTLSEAVSLSDGLGKLAGTLTFGELLDGAVGKAVKTPAATKATRYRAKAVATRTQAGRDAYDATVQAAVQKHDGPIGAEALRGIVGGSPLQLRAALHRLVDEKVLKRKGKARATKYMLR